MKKRLIVPVLLLSVFSLSMNACAGVPLPLTGREGTVVDRETGMPMEGVVALAVYTREILTVGGGHDEFVDATETVTDAKGKFSLPGPGLGLYITVTVFKAGYNYKTIVQWPLDEHDWDSYNDPDIKSEHGRPIFYLKKLTMKERAELSPPYPSDASPKKIRRYWEELDKDRVEQGLIPLRILEEQ